MLKQPQDNINNVVNSNKTAVVVREFILLVSQSGYLLGTVFPNMNSLHLSIANYFV